METIKLLGTDDTPGVILDAENEIFEISGRSLPEDVAAFYAPILEWLEDYAEDPNDSTVFNFKLTYFNTASSKMILDVLLQLEEMVEEGHDVKIIWHYPDDDEDMEEAGEEYEDIVEVPFEMKSYELD